VQYCFTLSLNHEYRTLFPTYLSRIPFSLDFQEHDRGLVTKVHAMLDVLEQRRMLIVYCLRLLIAPLIESTILDDRLQFRRENQGRFRDDQIDAFVIPIFEPLISARNLALFAWKK
jgi:hypothetical protein